MKSWSAGMRMEPSRFWAENPIALQRSPSRPVNDGDPFPDRGCVYLIDIETARSLGQELLDACTAAEAAIAAAAKAEEEEDDADERNRLTVPE